MSRKPSSAPMAKAVSRRADLASLHEDPGNVRRHGKKNLAAIRSSLLRFGQVEPLVVQAESGRVIGGNGRLGVMRELGWQECDIVEVAIDDTQAAALAIALNRAGELAEWDEDGLARMMATLKDADEHRGLGFDAADLRKMVNDLDSLGEDLGEVGEMEFRVVVEGLDEAGQAALLTRLEGEGYRCRALMS